MDNYASRDEVISMMQHFMRLRRWGVIKSWSTIYAEQEKKKREKMLAELKQAVISENFILTAGNLCANR